MTVEEQGYEVNFQRIKASKEDPNTEDKVNHPSHYQLNINGVQVEVLDIIKTSLTRNEFIGFLKGNCLKYTLRAHRKNQNEDWRKAGFYSKVIKELYENESLRKVEGVDRQLT